MVTSDMQRAADLLYHRIVVYLMVFNNRVQFTTFYMQRFTAVQVFFLLLVIVMDSIKSNLSVNFVEGIQ